MISPTTIFSHMPTSTTGLTDGGGGSMREEARDMAAQSCWFDA